MPGPSPDIWSEVARLRHELADRMEGLSEEQSSADSWCAGWRVGDVFGHLVYLAEATHRSVIRDAVRNGIVPDRFLDRKARALGSKPVSFLARRLRAAADGRYHAIGTPRAVALGELVVHGADSFRPLGLDFDPGPELVAPVLDVYRRVGRLAFHAAPQRRVRLVATDLDWVRGDGPEVNGRAIDLLLLMANRRQVVPSLSGPGLATIAE